MTTSDEYSELQPRDKPGDRPVGRSRRLQTRHSLELRSCRGIQGSDSGISMSSQEMKELLDVPWSMPKLKRNAWLRPSKPGLELSIQRDGAAPANNASDNQTKPDLTFQAKDVSSQQSNKENVEISFSNDNNKQQFQEDLSDLPFSMPKLERKLRECSEPKEGLELNLGFKPNRPSFLTASVPEPEPNPADRGSEPEPFLQLGPAPTSEQKPLMKPLPLAIPPSRKGNQRLVIIIKVIFVT